MWHARCYVQSERDAFPVLKASDLDDALMDEEDMGDMTDDPERFKAARAGDFLMCPFQCDACTFFNLKGRYPLAESNADEMLQVCIRRALLDAFWSRERSTVQKNRGEMIGFLEASESLGVVSPLPVRGPFPVGDFWGVGTACVMLKTMRSGRNADQIQFETARKVRSVVSNFVHTVPGGVGMATVSSGDRGGQFFTGSPTNSFWFRRFMTGCHRRMGDVWIPDRAATLEEVKSALVILESDLADMQETAGNHRALEVVVTGALVVIGYTAALRGEEIPQVDLGMLRKYWAEGRDYARKSHVPLALVGRFKQTNGARKVYVHPLADRTSSGIEIRLWTERAIQAYHDLGIKSGPMFRTISKQGKVRRSTVSDLDSLYHDILRRVQYRFPEVIPPDRKVEDEYSIRRSLRRGATTEAQNRGIDKDVLEANNRWKKHLRSRGVLPNMSMVERYSDAKASVEVLVKFSELM